MRDIKGLTLVKDKDKFKAPRMYNQEEINACMTKYECVPDIPEDVLGVAYEGKCTCGGTITAIRSPLNGYLGAHCDKCGFLLME